MPKKQIGEFNPNDKRWIFENKGEAVDILKGRIYVRTFSAKNHGEYFEKIANEFVANRRDGEEYRIVDSSTIPEVKVLFRERTETGTYVDRVKTFNDKRAALLFNNEVHGTVVVE